VETLTGIVLLDGLAIREMLPAWQHRPDAPPCISGSAPAIAGSRSRTSLRPCRRLLDGSAGLSWAVFRDEGISGTRGRDKRPGLDALLKGVARRDFDIVAAWSVCRLGRSLSDLIGLLGELRSRDLDLYLHQQALDTSTPSGRALFGMLGVFSEFERSLIRDRVMAGLDRARSSGKRLGRPRTTPFTVRRIRAALDEGRGVRDTARLLKVSAAKVSEVRRMSATVIDVHP
jgi:DNA invertase Pin-like site-specific DNA recombinase